MRVNVTKVGKCHPKLLLVQHYHWIWIYTNCCQMNRADLIEVFKMAHGISDYLLPYRLDCYALA